MLDEFDVITGKIIHSALRIHTGLGPGLFETVYEKVLARDLARRGLRVEVQKPVGFEFEGLHFDIDLRVGLVLNFGGAHMRDGIKRVANSGLEPQAPHGGRFYDR